MTVITDIRTPSDALSSLENLGFEILPLHSAKYLAPPVSSHPDMILFVGFGKLFCHRKYYEENKSDIEKILALSSYKLVLSDEHTQSTYPADVLFNCVTLGNNLLCNKNTISELILKEARLNNFNIIHTNQGYTKCSVCKIAEDAIITSDNSIYKACTKNNIDVLMISSGGVSLNGYDCGFIGGATGTYKDKVYFCGNVSEHPHAKRIIDFCHLHKKEVVSLSNSPLYDIGTMFFV